jgi:long-chain acyl-CoA synthetase
MFTNPLMRLLSRATRVVPIDPQRGPLSSLAFGVAALDRGYTLVWFPEGGLSRTGRLQRFRPGIGLMLRVQHVPVVPVWISGSQKALPPDQWRLRRHPIRITFGKQLDAEAVQRLGAGDQPPEHIAAVLRNCVAELGGQRESLCENETQER